MNAGYYEDDGQEEQWPAGIQFSGEAEDGYVDAGCCAGEEHQDADYAEQDDRFFEK